MPDKITLDKSGANPAAFEAFKKRAGQTIEMHQIKYPNNRIKQNHRAVKRILRPMLGFKVFDSAGRTWRGIERMPPLKKGRRVTGGGEKRSTAGPFYSLAGYSLARVAEPHSGEINAADLPHYHGLPYDPGGCS